MKVTLTLNLALEIIKYLLLGYVLFGAKVRRKWFAVGAFALYAILVFCGVMPTESLSSMSSIMQRIVIVILLVQVELPIKNRIMHAVKVFFIIVCIDNAVAMLLEILEEYIFLITVPGEVNWIISNTISISVLLGSCWVKEKRLMENSPVLQLLTKGIIYTCVGVMAFALPVTFSGLSYLSKEMNDPVFTKKMQILSAMFLFSLIALAMFIVFVNNTNKKMKKYLELEKTLKDTQKNYYEAMLAKEEDTRRFRHDVLNHLICVRELVEKGETAQASAYVEEIQGDIVKIQQRCYSVGNTIIDAFLNYYVQMLDDDVEVRVTGCLTEAISISDVELCTIFSNLMKNSMEELKKPTEEKKYLEIKVNTGREAFRIEISNSIARQLEGTKENLPKTTKADKKNHGIGLRNVRETVEKNCGTFHWEQAEKNFKTVVTLPLKSKE